MDTFLFYLVVVGASVGFGVMFGYKIATTQLKRVFKEFSDEMHRQYLQILRKEGIKLNEEGKEALRSTGNVLKRTRRSNERA